LLSASTGLLAASSGLDAVETPADLSAGF